MPASKTRPGDVTGRQAEALTAANAKEIRERQGSLGLITAPAPEFEDTVTDLSAVKKQIMRPEVTESDVEVVEVQRPEREIRVNSDLVDCTIGVDNHYTFEEGKRYRVPAHVADHLEEKGYVWH